MNKGLRIFNWCFSIYCFTAVLVFRVSFATVIFLLLGLASLPIAPVYKYWQQYTYKKWVRPLIIGLVFFFGLAVAPAIEEPENTSSVVIEEIATESPSSAASSTENTEDSRKLSTETAEETALIAERILVKEDTETQEGYVAVISPEETDIVNLPTEFSLSAVPAYSGTAYVTINNNVPYFTEADVEVARTSYEVYGELDSSGRCGVCVASVGQDIMPTEERGSIGSVKPTGWHTVKYDCVDGNYLYNRCHLLGYQLTGENANTKNLITGTRYMNVEGMLPFENMVADYVKETGDHVLYRVTPIFENSNLLASGVLMEAKSVEDNGEGILFCVYCYNVQPGVSIDYADGDSYLEETGESTLPNKPEIIESTADSASNTSTDSLSTSPSAISENIHQEPSQSDTNSTTTVWLSETGSKYHSINNCGRMNPDKAVQVTEEQAVAQGMGKCSKCW